MKKIIYIFIAALLSSCVKAPINGDLDGLWQLILIEKNDGTTSQQKDVFWAFQLHLVQLDAKKFYGRFQHSGSSLRIHSLAKVSSHVDNSQDDMAITENEISLLHQYGLYKLDTTFSIERLDNEAMILASDEARLTFRKY